MIFASCFSALITFIKDGRSLRNSPDELKEPYVYYDFYLFELQKGWLSVSVLLHCQREVLQHSISLGSAHMMIMPPLFFNDKCKAINNNIFHVPSEII